MSKFFPTINKKSSCILQDTVQNWDVRFCYSALWWAFFVYISFGRHGILFTHSDVLTNMNRPSGSVLLSTILTTWKTIIHLKLNTMEKSVFYKVLLEFFKAVKTTRPKKGLLRMSFKSQICSVGLTEQVFRSHICLFGFWWRLCVWWLTFVSKSHKGIISCIMCQMNGLIVIIIEILDLSGRIKISCRIRILCWNWFSQINLNINWNAKSSIKFRFKKKIINPGDRF